jgi:hypothetical protein
MHPPAPFDVLLRLHLSLLIPHSLALSDPKTIPEDALDLLEAQPSSLREAEQAK